MRWWLVIALLIGCGKSTKTGGTASGSGSAAPTPAGDAAVAVVADAAPAAAVGSAPHADVQRILGHYAIEITWTKPPACPANQRVPPPPGPKLAFDLTADPENVYKPQLHGIMLDKEDISSEADTLERGTKASVRASTMVELADGQASYELHLSLSLAGDVVTGEAGWEVGQPDGKPVCKAAGTVKGTRSGALRKEPSTQEIADAFLAAVHDGKAGLALVPAGSLATATIAGAPAVTVTADGAAAWVSADLASAAGKPADLHASALLAGPPWHALVVHVGASLTSAAQKQALAAGAAPPKLDRSIAPGAEAIAKRFESTIGEPLKFSWTIAAHDDSLLLGTEQKERFAGDGRARSTLQTWNLALTLRDGLVAGIAPGGNVGWVAANVDARNAKDPTGAPTPYRMTVIYEYNGENWEAVIVHFSFVAK